MRRLVTSLFILCVATTGSRAFAEDFDLDGDIYRNTRLGVEIAVPQGWIATRMTGYASMLALLSRSDGSRFSLSTDLFRRKESLIQIMMKNARAMLAVGITVESSRRNVKMGGKSLAVVNAKTTDGTYRIRQLYLLRGRRIYILTYSAHPQTFGRYLPDLDYIIESLKARHESWPDEETIEERGKRLNGRKAEPPTSPEAGNPSTAPTALPELGGDMPSHGDSREPHHVESRARSGRIPKGRPAPPQSRPKGYGSTAKKQPTSTPSSRPTSPGPADPTRTDPTGEL